jgi:hypothetical protein
VKNWTADFGENELKTKRRRRLRDWGVEERGDDSTDLQTATRNFRVSCRNLAGWYVE